MNTLELLRRATLQGHGLALLPDMAIAEDLADGQLVSVLTEVGGPRSHLSPVYPERACLLPKVRAFVDQVVAWADGESFGRRPPGAPRE